MPKPELIFCGGKNPNFARIATSHGFKYGAQLPCTTYEPVYFADQDWKNPNRASYMAELDFHKPHIATVLDLERDDQFDEVVSWAEEASKFVKVVIIIPKFVGAIQKIPKVIMDTEIRLGYSVPTKFSFTVVEPREFSGRGVHLLGGSPGAQMRLSHVMDVRSVDGNMMMKMANRGLFWTRGKGLFSNHWSSIKESDGKKWDGNATHEAFRRSCLNIVEAWGKFIYTQVFTEISGQ